MEIQIQEGWVREDKTLTSLICFDARPHLYPLPRERSLAITPTVNLVAVRKDSSVRFTQAAGTDSPSPWGEGRDEGGQNTNFPYLVSSSQDASPEGVAADVSRLQ